MPQLSAVMYFEGGGQLRFDAVPSLVLQADLGSWYRGPKGDKGDKGDDGVAGLHASTHATGGADELTPADIGAEEAGAAAAAVAAHAGASDPHGDRAYTDSQLASYQLTSQKGAAGGYAALDGSGKIPQAQIPSIAITEYLGEAADQTELLALVGQKGDWAVRTDLGTTWVIVGDDPTQLADWAELTYPGAPVLSVAGRTGTVTLTTDDLTDMTAAGKTLATAANAAAQRTALALGTAAQSNVDDFATGAEGDLAATAVQPADLTSAISTHAGAVDPHGDRAYTDSELADHVADSDPHADRAYTDSAISTHAGAADPHGDRSFTTSAISTHAGATDPHGDRAYTDTQLGSYQALSAKGVAGGYASLDGTGKIPQAQIPSVAISEYLGEAADQTELLALTGESGDWAVRTDLGTVWVIRGDDPSDINDWFEFVYPGAPVLSVAGRTGAVTLSDSDISGLGDAATKNVGTTAGTVAAGDDSRLDAAATIHAADEKTTPVDADEVGLVDSAASNILKRLTWANIKATLKSYFDTLYAAISHSHTLSAITDLYSTPPTTNERNADFTLAVVDVGIDQIIIDDGSPPTDIACSLPLHSVTPFVLDSKIPILKENTGEFTVDAPSGVTINGQEASSWRITDQYQGAVLQNRGPDTWTFSGAVELVV